MALSLNDDQIKQLADKLENNTNIYRLAETMFGAPISMDDSDELFERVQKAGVAKCPECDNWTNTSELSEGNGWCPDCEDDLDTQIE